MLPVELQFAAGRSRDDIHVSGRKRGSAGRPQDFAVRTLRAVA
jgi:hypothetical protein